MMMNVPLPDTHEKSTPCCFNRKNRLMLLLVVKEAVGTMHAMQLSHSQRSRQATIRDTEILRQHLKCSHCDGHLVDQRFYLHGFPGGHKLHGKNVKAKGKKSAAYNTQASTPQPPKRTSHRTGHVYS